MGIKKHEGYWLDDGLTVKATETRPQKFASAPNCRLGSRRLTGPALYYWQTINTDDVSAKKLLVAMTKQKSKCNIIAFISFCKDIFGHFLGHFCSGKCRNQHFESIAFLVYSIFFLFAFPLSPFLIFLLPWLTFYWACFKFKNFWESITKMENYSNTE